MRKLLIPIVILLAFGVCFAADYDGDKKADEIAVHGGAVVSTTRVFVQDPSDTDIVTYATAQEIVAGALSTSYDTAAEITAALALKLTITDIDDVAVDSETAAPISSNWAYDHENAADPHSVYLTGAELTSTLGAAYDTEAELLALFSADLDPDRLSGDAADNNLVDAELIEISGATTETTIAADDLILIYDTSATANRAMTRGNFVTGIGAGQAVVFDIGDDGGNDSTDVGEIATTGDTNAIFTEPSADKILIDLGNNWPQADTAVAAASQVITDNSIATVDDADAADNDFAKFTANGLEGRSYAETRQDLGIDSAANLETSLSLGDYASDILGAADSDALVTLLGLVAGDIPDLSATYEPQLTNSTGLASALSDETGTGVAVFGTGPTLTGLSMAGDITLGANEIQSSTDITIQLGDNAGTYEFIIQDSDGNPVFAIDSDGNQDSVSYNNPFLFLNENDGTDYYIGIYDTTTDRLEFRRSETVNTNVDAYLDTAGWYVAGNINIESGATYQINGTQINIGNLGAGGNWTPTGSLNLDSATLTLNSDALTVDNGSNYTTISNDAADDTIDELFDAINTWAAGVSAGTLVTLSDVGGSDVYTGGYILIGDNSDSYDPKAVGGDITLASDGTAALAADVVGTAEMDDADHGMVAWSGGTATVEDFALAVDADAGDFDITSVDKLEGVDAAVFIDMGADGIVQIAADTAIHMDVADETITVADGGTNIVSFGTDTGVTELNYGSFNMVTTGVLMGGVNINSKTAATYTVGTDDANESYGTLFVNGDNDAIDFTLPSAVAGMSACFMQGQGASGAITVQPNTGDYLVVDGVRGTAATDYSSSGAGGDKMCVVAIDATDWIVTTESGTWSE